MNPKEILNIYFTSYLLIVKSKGDSVPKFLRRKRDETNSNYQKMKYKMRFFGFAQLIMVCGAHPTFGHKWWGKPPPYIQ